MANREYVINSLKYLHDRQEWKEGPLIFDAHAEDRRRITADALKLLKEQEPVLMDGTTCPACHFRLGWAVDELGGKDNIEYCPHCGRRVKWDE